MADVLVENAHLILRLFTAGVLGALIGLERDIHGRAAGLRTHLLVSMGAGLFMVLSLKVSVMGGAGTPGDPGRIAAQIVTGIGFLGAGAILKEGFSVRGLTTASSLWIVASVGMASGAGCYALAGATSLVALISLTGLRRIERHYRKDLYRMITVVTTNDVEVTRLTDIVQGKGVKVLYADFDRHYETGETTFRLSVRLFHSGLTGDISREIIKAIEDAGIAMKEVKWGHREPF